MLRSPAGNGGFFCSVGLFLPDEHLSGTACHWGATGLSKASLGIIGSSFFWTYAPGQVTNGFLGDRVSSRWFIGLGLVSSALLNLWFGFARTLPLALSLLAAWRKGLSRKASTSGGRPFFPRSLGWGPPLSPCPAC
ncbi:MAG: hypothetical protein ACOX18_06575 [Bacillota bacterium]